MELDKTTTTLLSLTAAIGLSGCTMNKELDTDKTTTLAEDVREKIIQLEIEAIQGAEQVKGSDVFMQTETYGGKAKLEVLLVGANNSESHNLLITDTLPMGLGSGDLVSGVWDNEVVQYTINSDDLNEKQRHHTWMYAEALKSIRTKLDSIEISNNTQETTVRKENLTLRNLGKKSEIQSKIDPKYRIEKDN